jgi:PAS domain-containing protein
MAAILVGTGDGLCLIDADRRYVYANPAACQTLGHPLERLRGRDFLAIPSGMETASYFLNLSARRTDRAKTSAHSARVAPLLALGVATRTSRRSPDAIARVRGALGLVSDAAMSCHVRSETVSQRLPNSANEPDRIVGLTPTISRQPVASHVVPFPLT